MLYLTVLEVRAREASFICKHCKLKSKCKFFNIKREDSEIEIYEKRDKMLVVLLEVLHASLNFDWAR